MNYADDCAILSCGKAAGVVLDWTRQVMARMGVILNKAKTGITFPF
ncbi:MAG TPA: hypothetical protein VKV15_20395 [Bryobacteraceae bacterium]|nr:hypothetical protein [Bryobacteraceae bacterium]